MSDIKEQNKRKQQFLNLNGIKVKIDGSWGPWQEEQYRKLTTKDKHYNITPLGFLSYVYDKTLGNGTTYQEDPTFVKGYSGEIKPDNRSSVRKYLDQQMQDNKTPLGYITQTVLPSTAVAGTLVYGSPAIMNGIRTAVSNPSTILPAVKTFVKEGIKGGVGATALNAVSKATTGKTWGEQIAQSAGVSSDLGEFTNPGFVLGPSIYNISKNLSKLNFKPLIFPFKNAYRKYVIRPKKTFDFKSAFDDIINNDPDLSLYNKKTYFSRIKQAPLQLEDQFGNKLIYRNNIPESASFLVSNKELQQITPEIRNQVFNYKQNFQNLIGKDGVVYGSTRGISNGYINGTLNNDTEIITTKLRFEQLKNKLNFQFNRENSVGGYSGTSPFAKGKTNEVEFDFIDESPNGLAKGTLAHSIYSVLHPEKRANVINKILNKNRFNKIRPDDIELPITSEELYQQFYNAPEEIKDLVFLVDMLGSGINTANEANAMKHGERAWNVLLNQKHVSQVYKAIDILGKKWFGSTYKIPSKEYPNLKFDDIEANKEFINNIINIVDKKIPDNYVDKIASNPQQMENLFNYWYQNNLITHRQVNIPGESFTPQQTWDALFNQIHSVGGGAHSGVGRNSTSGKIIAFPQDKTKLIEGITQALITFYPNKIKNLSQFTKKFQEISNPDIVNDFSIYKGNHSNSKWSLEQESEVLRHIHSLDRPIVRSITTKRGVGAYDGSYIGSNYPQDFDPILGQRLSAVSYNQSPEFGFAFSPQFSTRRYKNFDSQTPFSMSDVDPEFEDRIVQIIKTITSFDPIKNDFIYNPKQITNLKNIGFDITDKGGLSQAKIIKQTQKYINSHLPPNERLSLKDTRYFLNSTDKSLEKDLIKKMEQGKRTLQEQNQKYWELIQKQKNRMRNIKHDSFAIGAGSLPTGLIYLSSQHDKKTREDAINIIYNQLSQEQQTKISKEDIAKKIRRYYRVNEENMQEVINYLKSQGYKFKDVNK